MSTEVYRHFDPAALLPESRVFSALRLDAFDRLHLIRVAEIIKDGGIVAMHFNGPWGLFGAINNVSAAEAIIEAKKRPEDKKLIAVCTPENIGWHSDIRKTKYTEGQIVSLLCGVHALGVILPASPNAPAHLTVGEGQRKTLLTICTEYAPLRTLLGFLDTFGIKGLVGTSANKSGAATHIDADSVYAEFKTDVQAVVNDSSANLPLSRKMSTSLVDLTGYNPILRRLGNVTEDELRESLSKFGFPELEVGPDVVIVRARVTS